MCIRDRSNPGLEPDSDFSQIIVNGVRDDPSVDPFHLHANLEDGAWHDLTVTWSADSNTLAYWLDGDAVAQKSYDAPNLLWGGAKQVWYGFGGATGGLSK